MEGGGGALCAGTAATGSRIVPKASAMPSIALSEDEGDEGCSSAAAAAGPHPPPRAWLATRPADGAVSMDGGGGGIDGAILAWELGAP